MPRVPVGVQVTRWAPAAVTRLAQKGKWENGVSTVNVWLTTHRLFIFQMPVSAFIMQCIFSLTSSSSKMLLLGLLLSCPCLGFKSYGWFKISMDSSAFIYLFIFGRRNQWHKFFCERLFVWPLQCGPQQGRSWNSMRKPINFSILGKPVIVCILFTSTFFTPILFSHWCHKSTLAWKRHHCKKVCTTWLLFLFIHFLLKS